MKRKIISGKCAKCGEHLIVPTWKYCDGCTYPNNIRGVVLTKSGVPTYKVSNVKWLMLVPFKGSYHNSNFWRDMYEIIALDDEDNEVGRLEFTEYSTGHHVLQQLATLYKAKVI